MNNAPPRRGSRCVVVGGGLAGLIAAHALRDHGVEVVVLEADDVPGGKVRTFREDGYLLEWGPQTFLFEEESAINRAIVRAHLFGELVHPLPEAKQRFVLKSERLYAVPRDLPRLLSAEAILRGACEPLIHARRRASPESVEDFARRRFGAEAARVLFDALVSGIYAGDPARLELHTALPRLHALETQHGSVVRAFLKGGFTPRPVAGLRRGMGSLPEVLGLQLGAQLLLSRPVQEILEPDQPGFPWRVRDLEQEHEADAVLLTTPAHVTAGLVLDLDPELGQQIAGIPYAGVVVVALGYPKSGFHGGAPRGFGFLIPHQEEKSSLGCLFPSATFVGLAPEDQIQLRVIAGGRRRPELLEMSDEEILRRIRQEIEPVLGAASPPTLERVYRHPRAIPQYELGHAVRLEAITARLRRHPGLYLAGNPYRGISVGDVAEDAERIAAQIAQDLAVVSPPL